MLPSECPHGCAICGDAAERQTPLMQNSFAFAFVLWLCSLKRNISGLLETEFLWLQILYLRIRDSEAPYFPRGHGPFRADSRTVCAVQQQCCRQSAGAGVPFARMQRIHRTSDPSQAERFCIHSSPVALLSGTQYCGVLGCSVFIESQIPLRPNRFAFVPVLCLCYLERNIMGLLETGFVWLRILHRWIRDSGAPNCLRGRGPLRADS